MEETHCEAKKGPSASVLQQDVAGQGVDVLGNFIKLSSYQLRAFVHSSSPSLNRGKTLRGKEARAYLECPSYGESGTLPSYCYQEGEG